MKTNYVKPMSEIITPLYGAILLSNSGSQSDDADAKPIVFDEEDEDIEEQPWGKVSY